MTHVSFRGTGTTLGDNVGLVAALIAVVVAQVLKPFSAWAITGRFKASLMVGSGVSMVSMDGCLQRNPRYEM